MFCKNSVRWLYRLEQSYSWDSGHSLPEDLVFRDKISEVRLVIERDGRITVTRGYAWDGCTPNFCLFDFLIGVPDGVVHVRTGRPKTYYATLVHDALYQFLPDGLPLTRRRADEFFLRLMAESDFGPRWIYWIAVRLFGGLFRRAARGIRKTRGTCQAVKL